MAWRLVPFCLLLLLSTGCARALHVASEPSPVYRLAIANDTDQEMVVTYHDGQRQGLLGAVPAGRSDTFVVATPASAAVTITARNAAGTRTLGPFSVQLAPGETVTLRLR
jgi:hypothetical protein